MNSFEIKEALALLDRKKCKYRFVGNSNIIISYPYQIEKLAKNGLAFYRGDNPEQFSHLFNNTNLVILKELDTKKLPSGNYLVTDDPSLCFNIIGWLLKPNLKYRIHKTALISTSAKISRNVHIGAYTVIGENVIIKANTIIEEQCVIKKAEIGENVIIRPGVKIGSMGLGSQMDQHGRWHEFPNFGRVLINNDVIIHDNVVINCGTLNDTEISSCVRIGPSSSIGQGVFIGKSVIIAPGVFIAGSVKIGDYTKIWGNASIRDGINIGAYCVVGMGTVATKDIPDHQTWIGNPARAIGI